ncbi:MAG TPA: Rrf2 family transcriptional regulator [Candidatus Omnitrophota bacterium]|nr:Rrf2 family transcriptional regulator [Candidatus Omnitrophota bacterium]
MIDRRTDYALRCLLCLARKGDASPLPAAELSRKLKISRVFAAKILQTLASAGIVRMERGRLGGARLLSKKVNVLRVIRLFEPDHALNKCLNHKYHCFMEKSCPLHRFFLKLQRELEREFKAMTIERLVKGGGKQ